ncbi:MAG: amidophosphoribosyltransferase, partial [Bacteroidetes bacterium]|nr:amidophosphoribosyltransferase [Bacteroidota bacterium]
MSASEFDKPRCHCAVLGVFGTPTAAQLAYYGLLAQQHRGQEGSGIVTSEFDKPHNRYRFHVHKDFGLVDDVYRDPRVITESLRGTIAIGHNRY